MQVASEEDTEWTLVGITFIGLFHVLTMALWALVRSVGLGYPVHLGQPVVE